jgi:hypothetical protein
MKDFVKTLLGIGLTVGLSDRESFVKSVSGMLAEYQEDPKKAEKWAKAIVDYLEQVRNNVNLQSSIKGAVADIGISDQQKVTELTQAIEELTLELRKFKDKR